MNNVFVLLGCYTAFFFYYVYFLFNNAVSVSDGRVISYGMCRMKHETLSYEFQILSCYFPQRTVENQERHITISFVVFVPLSILITEKEC